MTRRYAHESHVEMAETAGHRPSQDELRAERDAEQRRRQRAARAKTAVRDRPEGDCAICGRHITIHARGLCGSCYRRVRIHHPDTLAAHPTQSELQLEDVDDIAVERAADWLETHAALPPAERPAHATTRPHLTRGERIAVLARTRHTVPRWVAIEALGISGRYATHYLEQAAS